MSKHPDWEDDSFDDFIRRSVEEPQIPFDPKAWEAMEQKLDAAAGGQDNAQKGGSKGGRIAGLVVAVLLLSGLAWFVFSGEEKPDMGKEGSQQSVALNEQTASEEKKPAINPATDSAPAENAEEPSVQEGENSQSSSTATTARVADDGQEQEQEQEEKQDDTEAGNLPRKSSQNVRIAENSAAEEPTAVEPARRAVALAAEKNADTGKVKANSQEAVPPAAGRNQGTGRAISQEASRQPAREEAELLNDRPHTEQNSTAKTGAGDEENGTTGAMEEAASQPNEAESLFVTARENRQEGGMPFIERKSWLPFVFSEPVVGPLAIRQEEISEKTVVLPPKTREAPLSVSLTLAPDFTGTGQQGSTKMGAGVGLQLEYKILPCLSVVSGAFYSKKNYLTDNSFSPYGKFWDYRPEPDHIDASCGVIDIPLNLRFYALNGNRHRFFLSGGLSSYLMRSEDYTLVYSDGQWDDYTYEVRNENHHLFAIYNLSVGYERNFAGRWALQLEPFMKIPARGVGTGSVKLNSMGAFVHLKYKIIRQGK